jgi:hypothetical protein
MDTKEFSIDFPENESQLTSSLDSSKCTVLKILKCPSTSQTTKLIAQEWFTSSIHTKFPSIVAIRMKISGAFNLPHDWQPRVCEFKGKHQFLISLESDEKNEMVFHWKNEDSEESFRLDLTDEKVDGDVKEFAVNFLIEGLEKGENGEHL